MSSIPEKQCRRCGETFPATDEYFYRNRQARDGFQSYCKQCQKGITAEYAKRNPEKWAEYTHRWREKNHDKWQSINRQNANNWRKANPDKHLASRERRRRAKGVKPQVRRTPEEQRERQRLYELEWRAKNRDKKRANGHNYQARKRGLPGTLRWRDIKLLYESQKGLCWWCGEPLNDLYHMDHRIPISKGGGNDPSNICLTCPRCNHSKKDRLPWEWNGRLL